MSVTSKVLIGRYEAICNKIIEEFREKQGLEFNGWIGECVGDIASFNTIYFFSMSDIILDLRENIQKGKILEWQDDNLSLYAEREEWYINYKTYVKDRT